MVELVPHPGVEDTLDATRVVYRLDASGRIVWVSPSWNTFAALNGAPDLAHLEPGTVSVWKGIADGATAELYRRLFSRVRATSHPVSFGLRCDAPDRRRFLTMSVAPGPDGTIEMTTTTWREEPRPAVRLFEAHAERGAERGAELVRVCSWCGRVAAAPGVWLEVEDALKSLRLFERDRVPGVTHGICEDCTKRVLATIEEEPER